MRSLYGIGFGQATFTITIFITGLGQKKEAQVVFTFGKPKEQCLEMLNELDTVTNSEVCLRGLFPN